MPADHVYKLAANDADEFAKSLAQMVQGIWIEKGMPETINKDVTRAFVKELMAGVTNGYGKTLGQLDYDSPDYNMLASLQRDVYHFSAAKNYQQLKALTQALVGEDGKLRSKSEFFRAAYEINNEHVNVWLETERNTAISSAQMAGKWVDIQKNKGTLKLLQYDSVIDSHTTDLCRNFNGIILPVDHPFWDQYYPPNHYNERATVRQLLNGTITNDADIVYNEKIPEMFRVNLGKRGLAFPPSHPYYNGVPQHVFNDAAEMDIFKAANSIKEAEAYLIENKVSKKVNYNGLSANVANDINKTLFELHQRWNLQPLESVGEAVKGKSNALASANGKHLNLKKTKLKPDTIQANYTAALTNYKANKQRLIDAWERLGTATNARQIAQLKEAIKYDRFTVQTTEEAYIKELILHEGGHVIQDQLLGMINKGLIQKRFIKPGSNWFEPIEATKELRNEFNTLYGKYKTGEFKYTVSAYSQTHTDEFFAETFVMYNQEKDKLPDDIINFYDKLNEYAKKY